MLSNDTDKKPFSVTPFFWTRHYNKSIAVVGHCTSYDKVHIDGNLLEGKFLAYYINEKEDKIVGISGMGRNHDIMTLMEAFNRKQMPKASAMIAGRENAASI